MRSIRWLLLLCGMLCLQDAALGDACVVGAIQGAYTLNLCVGPSSVIENGPLGTEPFQINNNFISFSDLSLALNDHGQWALVTGGGTSDQGTLNGQYTGRITVPPIEVPNAQGSCHSSGIQPGGTLVGNYRNLGYHVRDNILFPFSTGGCFAYPKIPGITDQGQVSAEVAYTIDTTAVGELTGSIDYDVELPGSFHCPRTRHPVGVHPGITRVG